MQGGPDAGLPEGRGDGQGAVLLRPGQPHPPTPGPHTVLQRDLEQQLEGLLASLVSGIRLEATSALQHGGR